MLPHYNREMHFEGVSWIGIKSVIPLLQLQWHAAVHTDVNILPWLSVDWWSIWDTCILFLRTLPKKAYRHVKKARARSDLAQNLLAGFMLWLHICDHFPYSSASTCIILREIKLWCFRLDTSRAETKRYLHVHFARLGILSLSSLRLVHSRHFF